jgi:hypothetical protein
MFSLKLWSGRADLNCRPPEFMAFKKGGGLPFLLPLANIGMSVFSSSHKLPLLAVNPKQMEFRLLYNMSYCVYELLCNGTKPIARFVNRAS